MSMQPSKMSTSSLLLDLPVEILHQILTYLIPSDQTFRLVSRRPKEQRDPGTRRRHRSITPRPRAVSEMFPYEPALVAATNESEISASDPDFTAKSTLPLLLAHPRLHREVAQVLYANNSFSFPDHLTLDYFAQCHTHSNALVNITSISVDACGYATYARTCTTSFFRFCYPAEAEIVDTVKLFPALRQVWLGGVGPGAKRKFKIHSSNGREFDSIREDHAVWKKDGIELVARLVGLDIDRDYEESVEPSDAEASKPDSAIGCTVSSTAIECTELKWANNPGPLKNGHVICAKPANPIPQRISWNRLLMYGTRIVRQGEPIILSEQEQEIKVADLPLMVKVARKIHTQMEPLAGQYPGRYHNNF